MSRFTCILLVLLAATLGRVQATPFPEPTPAKPAIIDAGTEKNIPWVKEYLVDWVRVAVRDDKEVSELPIIRRQKDWEAWLKKNLCVERIPETNHVRVSFRDGNAQEQAAIVNVVVNDYLARDVARRRASERDTLQRIRDINAELSRRGRLTEKQMAKYEKAVKEREEYIRTLPKLLEPAKVR